MFDPVAGVGAESRSHVGIESFYGSQQSEVSFFNQILKSETFSCVSACDVDNETKVGPNHSVPSANVALRDGTGEFFFFIRIEQIGFVDFPQIGFEGGLEASTCLSCFRTFQIGKFVFNGGNIFVATDIRTAEAAKVIENAQRDINIAFINEIAIIFERMGLSTHDVLEAEGTKWNFLNFKPGLVGGHCIGIDPYYLAHSAEAVGLDPEIVLAGRRINDGLSAVIAARVDELCAKEARILVLGITFKENVPDIRNSKVVDLVRQLKQSGRQVDVFDPFADPIETEREYGICPVVEPTGPYGCAVAAVAHDIFQAQTLYGLLSVGGVVVDIKGIWRHENWANGIRYWSF